MVEWTSLDRALVTWMTETVSRSDALQVLLVLVQPYAARTLPVILLFWMLWFLPRSGELARRERLLSVLIVAPFAVLVARLLAAVLLPFRPRPVNSPLLDLDPELFPPRMEHMSAMPSDHALLFACVATGLMMVHRKAGAVAFAYAVFVTMLPRAFLGFHWPSDLLVGAAVGTGLALLLVPPVTRLVHTSRIVPYFEARPHVGYPLLFLVSYETATMFDYARKIVATFVIDL